MSIGSAPEIGVSFKTGLWTIEEAREWRKMVGSDLMGGYGTLAYPNRLKYAMSEFPLVPYTD